MDQQNQPQEQLQEQLQEQPQKQSQEQLQEQLQEQIQEKLQEQSQEQSQEIRVELPQEVVNEIEDKQNCIQKRDPILINRYISSPLFLCSTAKRIKLNPKEFTQTPKANTINKTNTLIPINNITKNDDKHQDKSIDTKTEGKPQQSGSTSMI